MSLSDRLQRARTQQLIESGVLPADFVLEPEPERVAEVEREPVVEEAEEHGRGLFAPVTIEVHPIGLHLVPAGVDLTDMPGQESEGRCPTCNAIAVVDMVDLVGHTVHYTCGTCSTMWQVRKAVVREGIVAS
jgi:hypothetical protein